MTCELFIKLSNSSFSFKSAASTVIEKWSDSSLFFEQIKQIFRVDGILSLSLITLKLHSLNSFSKSINHEIEIEILNKCEIYL